jgi:hypothetical protein
MNFCQSQVLMTSDYVGRCLIFILVDHLSFHPDVASKSLVAIRKVRPTCSRVITHSILCTSSWEIPWTVAIRCLCSSKDKQRTRDPCSCDPFMHA